MQYTPVNLPKYWKIHSRNEFSNAIVKTGHVLLFSQNGQSIVAKQPDGSFQALGQSAVFGVIGQDGKFLTLNEQGQISDSQSVSCYKSWYSPVTEPSAGKTSYYKCTTVQQPYTVQACLVVGAGKSDVNGLYIYEGEYGGQPYYLHDNKDYVIAYWSDGGVYCLVTYQAFQNGSVYVANSYYMGDAIDVSWNTINGTDPAPSVSSMTVTKGGKTWQGQRAVFNGSYYEFQDSITSGLTYTDTVPIIGKIYSQDARVRVAGFPPTLPTQDLVFYASLGTLSTAETGQAISRIGTSYVSQYDGVPCTVTGGGSGNPGVSQTSNYYTTSFTKANSSQNYTVSVWVNFNAFYPTGSGVYTQNAYFLSLGSGISGSTTIKLYQSSDGYLCLRTDNAHASSIVMYPFKWYHMCFTKTGTNAALYINGEEQLSCTDAASSLDPSLCLFTRSDRYYWAYPGTAMAAVRIYNRVLSAQEILLLSKEFTTNA